MQREVRACTAKLWSRKDVPGSLEALSPQHGIFF